MWEGESGESGVRLLVVSGSDESYGKPRGEIKGGTGQGVPTVGRVLTFSPSTSALSFLFREDSHCLSTFADALLGLRCWKLNMFIANLLNPWCIGMDVSADAGVCAGV